MDMKKEIVEKYESGIRIRDLAAAYRMPRTTISTICAGDNVSEAIICDRAKMIHANLLKIKAGPSQESAVFKASHGRFDNFKKRPGIHCVVRQGKGANADKDAAKDFVKEFGKFVETEGFVRKQVFNCDETGL
ncbi:hypothetical protein CBL_21277, partial [Carabus blaptoides fortunei]